MRTRALRATSRPLARPGLISARVSGRSVSAWSDRRQPGTDPFRFADPSSRTTCALRSRSLPSFFSRLVRRTSRRCCGDLLCNGRASHRGGLDSNFPLEGTPKPRPTGVSSPPHRELRCKLRHDSQNETRGRRDSRVCAALLAPQRRLLFSGEIHNDQRVSRTPAEIVAPTPAACFRDIRARSSREIVTHRALSSTAC